MILKAPHKCLVKKFALFPTYLWLHDHASIVRVWGRYYSVKYYVYILRYHQYNRSVYRTKDYESYDEAMKDIING